MSSTVETRAPGRVNLIGEHTDYNDGFVLPCAIAYDTRVRASPRADNALIVHSRFDEPARFDLAALPLERSGLWTDYVRGMILELQAAGVRATPADLQVEGTVPLGAGLSSSASFEVAVGLALLALADVPMPPLQLALLAQRAEIQHVGTRCGIMDQFVVLHAQQGFALFLDTRTLDYTHVAFPQEAAILICNSMVKHELAASAYNERRKECERSVEILRERSAGVHALRDATLEDIATAASELGPLLTRRARHVVSENARVLAAVDALRHEDLPAMGRLMYASHASLRDDFEVSSPELDALVAAASAFDGTIGARMTGGGFGGCTVNVVLRERAQAFREHVARAFAEEIGVVPAIYDGTPSAGAAVLRG